MLYLASGVITLSVFVALWAIYGLVSGNGEKPIQQRLHSLSAREDMRRDADGELRKPLLDRLLRPVVAVLGSKFVSFTPRGIHKLVEEKIFALGGLGGMGVEGFIVRWVGFAVLCALVAAAAASGQRAAGDALVRWTILGLAVGLLLPLLMINGRIRQRRERIGKQLPDALDLITISVEAGLGFDGALSKLAEKMKGPLVAEFNRALQEMRMGIPRRQALLSMGDRCAVQDVSLFISAINQADQLGVGIANVLRVQSEMIRERRKQAAEEKAMKAPVKMLIPLILFIFPCIFIVLLGPALLAIMSGLGNR